MATKKSFDGSSMPPASEEMTSEPDTDPNPKPRPLARIIAHALWEIDLAERDPEADKTQRQEAWNKDKAAYVRKAKILVRRLLKKDLEITVKPPAQIA